MSKAEKEKAVFFFFSVLKKKKKKKKQINYRSENFPMGIFLWRVNVILSSPASAEPRRSVTDFEHATPLLPQGTLYASNNNKKKREN